MKRGGVNQVTGQERTNLRNLGFTYNQINDLQGIPFDNIIQTYKDVAGEEHSLDLDNRQELFNDMLSGIDLQEALIRELPEERRIEHESGARNYLVGFEGVTNAVIARDAYDSLMNNNNNNNNYNNYNRQGGRTRKTRKPRKTRKSRKSRKNRKSRRH